MYSFLRRPIWILNHVLIAALIVVLISLGFWQRSRYYEEKSKKEQLEAAAAATPVALDEVVDPGADPGAVPENAKYERVKVSGTYDTANEVVVNNRSSNGAPGSWVLTPVLQADGRAVAVVRGWVPLSLADSKVPLPESLPPQGQVEVTGVVQLTQERLSIGPVDPADGKLDHLARVDLVRLAKQLPYDLEPVWVLLDGQTPKQNAELPQLVSLQPTDPSQNFSYMVQWWIFASIALMGYPLVLRAVARNKAGIAEKRYATDDGEVPWADGLGPGSDSGVGIGSRVGSGTEPTDGAESTRVPESADDPSPTDGGVRHS